MTRPPLRRAAPGTARRTLSRHSQRTTIVAFDETATAEVEVVSRTDSMSSGTGLDELDTGDRSSAGRRAFSRKRATLR
jgi:hypothetical protein